MVENESPPLDSEDWNIVFQPYAEYPILAFILAQHLDCVKQLIQRGSEGREEAIAGLDRAVESLMPHTNFRDVGRTVYLSAVAGNLSPNGDGALLNHSKFADRFFVLDHDQNT